MSAAFIQERSLIKHAIPWIICPQDRRITNSIICNFSDGSNKFLIERSLSKPENHDIGTQSMSLIANFPHSPSQEAPLYEAAQEIDYLEKVILETLRLNSPAGK